MAEPGWDHQEPGSAIVSACCADSAGNFMARCAAPLSRWLHRERHSRHDRAIALLAEIVEAQGAARKRVVRTTGPGRPWSWLIPAIGHDAPR